MMRDQHIDRLYAVVSQYVPISRTAYGNSLFGWDIDPILIDGMEAGLIVMRGPEIHVHIEKHVAVRHARRLIRACITNRLPAHGYLTTRSLPEEKTVRFLKRLGFYQNGMDGRLQCYRLDKLNIK